MLKYKSFALLLLAFAGLGSLKAQYSINSPYSRYGYGDLNISGTSFNQAMGGTGIALREANFINYLNPSSYNTQDTMSFIWDFGVMGNMKKSVTSNASNSMKTMNFDHVAFSFPVTRKYFMAFGVLPYSKVGYNIRESGKSDTTSYVGSYYGSGNLNMVFIGNSIGLFKKKVNVGVNVNYLFGSIDHNRDQNFYGINDFSYTQSTNLSGWNAVLGAQTAFALNSSTVLSFGATYQTKTTLTGTNYETAKTSGSVLIQDTADADYEIPARLGVGVNLNYNSKLIIALDYIHQNWSGVKVPGNFNALNSDNRINFGVQYTPDRTSYISYLDRVRYRVGGYFDYSYLEINNKNINDYGVTVGFGLPFKRTNTMFNTALEYGFRGTTSNNLIRENYFRLTLSVSLYDFWFIKRRYQ